MTLSRLQTILLASFITLMAISLITFPKASFDASLDGLDMWWSIVFPSLLPFFIVSEMLIGFGVVSFLGVILEPIMRPLFRVPGVGGFVWAMGMASGFPAGAKFTARLRQEKQLTAIEAERLVSFTNSSNPLFIFGAVAVGFFGNPQIGILLAISHYLGNVCVGFMMRFHGNSDQESTVGEDRKGFSLIEALRVLHRTRLEEKRPLGKMLGDAVTSSIQTLLMIGGFIILFSVLNRLLSLVHFTDLVGIFLSFILQTFHLSTELSVPLISGLFEITLGSDLTSDANAGLLEKVVIVSFILAFCGFSVQAQVASILSETDIRFKPFFIARIFHGFFASIFAFILWKPLYVNLQASGEGTVPVMKWFEHSASYGNTFWTNMIDYGPLFTLLSLCIYIVIIARRGVAR
ncbi:sporulation integral membrane protein YlbJ [Bacillus mesophilus]|uniref:Sporulation integral membrane protein YlbJ n=1 Tax=Bacillus mesophilus TaxID=1808955 RepID=A0A6M0Q2M0_9BACI|nr:sporulation integral membrane protein YlbJ [Bacillus mesophilus]MBM7659480.1 sporulation integral membrane protein YlbJ [Bacillus mesophilus]NEY70353.1 sporulation integral membrane protein YlbJ [Bacillus mesophilus]